MSLYPDILLATMWATVLWLILLGVPFALPITTVLSAAIIWGRVPIWASGAALALSLLAEVAARAAEVLFVKGQGRALVAMSGGLVTLGLLFGPELGPVAWGLMIGPEGRELLQRGRRLGNLFILGRLIRGGAALALALWIFGGPRPAW